MTDETELHAPTRFRTARVVTPTTDADRIEALLGDGARMYAEFEQASAQAAADGNFLHVFELAEIAARTDDAHRAYAVRRFATSLVISTLLTKPQSHGESRARALDGAVALLAPSLERNSHEPELLDLLGVALLELGECDLALTVFDALAQLDPAHAAVEDRRRACAARMQRAGSATVKAAPPAHAPWLAEHRSVIDRITAAAKVTLDRTVSLCMIVRDEEEMLPGCLEAVARHVDQLVIVDTGSVDRTREIALEHGATVIDFAWTGSFSDARNEALRHATGDWILYLDADEHLVADDGAALRELARRTWIEGYHLVETHFVGAEGFGSEAVHTPMRMFQRREGQHWRGTVHEQINWSMPTWLPDRFEQTSIRVNHYGYLVAVVEDRDKRARNLDLLMSQVASERTAFTCFNIGTEHGSAQAWDDAVGWFEEALAISRLQQGWQQQSFAPLMVQRTVAARRLTGDVAGSIELAREALEWWPDYTDLIYDIALAQRELGYAGDAEAAARQALELGDAPARYVAIAGKGSFQARNLLASLLADRGDLTGAREQLQLAVTEAPRYLDSSVQLTQLLLAQRDVDPAEASRIVDETLAGQASDPAPNMLIGAVFHEHGAFDVADARYARVLAASPAHAGARLARAELRLAQGELQEGYELAMSIEPLDPMAPRGACTAFLAAAAIADPELIGAPAARIDAAHDSVPAAERAVYCAWSAMLAPHIATDGATVTSLVPPGTIAAGAVLRNLEALAKLEATNAFEQLHGLLQHAMPDERPRRIALAELYLRRRFADMAGEELMVCAERFGADATVLRGLGKVATIKEMWEDATVLLTESLRLDPGQPDARNLLAAVEQRVAR